MTTSAAGRKFLTAEEGRKLKAYRCSAGVLTIGVGHTSAAGAPKVTAGMTITAAEADAIFARDLVKYENTVVKSVKVAVTQNQFDALVSLCFNIGQGAFSKSTLVRKLNAGDTQGAANEFLKWSKQPELLPRRKREKALFLKGPKKAPEKPVEPVEPIPAPEPAPEPVAPPEPPVRPTEPPAPEVPTEDDSPLKPLAKSKELWAGIMAIFAALSTFLSDLHSLDAKTQLWVIGAICILGTAAGLFMIVNRVMARKRGER